MFGLGRRRRAAAAEAAREAERRALFTQLAQRPENICPFLGLAYERTGYVDGPSIEHRCFAFGDPAPLSSEQQIRVCQERGYGQCPRYLRGLLVTPPEELQALRNPAAAAAVTVPAKPTPAAVAPAPQKRRRGIPILLLLVLALLFAGGGATYLFLSQGGFVGLGPDPTATTAPSAQPTAASQAATATAAPTPQPESPAPSASAPSTPSPEPTPAAGDTFAFYEVSVGPGRYPLYELDASGQVVGQRTAAFDDFSFARVEPIEGADGEVYWQTVEGGLAGLSYRYPDSGDFGIRAVFLDDSGERRSVVLAEDELDDFPEAAPAP